MSNMRINNQDKKFKKIDSNAEYNYLRNNTERPIQYYSKSNIVSHSLKKKLELWRDDLRKKCNR
jgi:hypothetical protein